MGGLTFQNEKKGVASFLNRSFFFLTKGSGYSKSPNERNVKQVV
jgi:hypothetical protein